MPTEAQINANRLNAQKSTGPTSPEGKARSSLNALKSGIDAWSHIIPGEDPAELEALTAAFLLHFRPADPIQLSLVDTLISTEWIQRRLRRIEAQLWNYQVECLDKNLTRADFLDASIQHRSPLGHAFHAALDPFSRIQRRIDSTNRMFLRTLKALQDLRPPRPPNPPSSPAHRFPNRYLPRQLNHLHPQLASFRKVLLHPGNGRMWAMKHRQKCTPWFPHPGLPRSLRPSSRETSPAERGSRTHTRAFRTLPGHVSPAGCVNMRCMPGVWGGAAGAAFCGAGALMVYGVRGRSSTLFAPSVYRGPAARRAIALTFDDGPSESTPALLRMLADQNVPATFFQCGGNVERLPEIARDVARSGHEIGNHSQTHPRFIFRTPAFIQGELARAQESIERASGVSPVLFRAPFGVRWPGMREAQSRLHLMGVMWTVIGCDWRLDARAIVGRVLPAIENGAIICLHDGRELQIRPDVEATLDAVRRLLPVLKAEGYRFETVSQLICPTN